MDFPKKYTHQSIQQDHFVQKKIKFFGIKDIKKAGQKNTINLVSCPILLTSNSTPYDQLIQTVNEDCIAKYFRLLGKQTRYCPRFGYQTGNHEIENKKIWYGQWITQMKRERDTWIKLMIQLGVYFDPKESFSLLEAMTTRKIRNHIDYYMQQWWIKDDIAINYRSNKRQTNISSEEITRKITRWPIYHIRYFVDTKNITVVVATHSPETIFGDVALAVHPEDKRYKKLIGKKVIIPMINKPIPIIWETTIDITKHGGIMRVSPCHDAQSLAIAQKHGLPTNTFAIDHHACFTKLAGDFGGKKVDDFLGNILQNLSDIHNLESTQEQEYPVPTDKTSWEILQPILSQQWSFVVPDAYTSEANHDQLMKDVNIQPAMYHELWQKSAANQTYMHRPISQKDDIGIWLPVRENEEDSYFVWEYDIISIAKKKAKHKKIIPALLLFNLIADRRIDQAFSIDEFVQTILTVEESDKPLGELYIDAFSKDFPRGYSSEINEFLKLFSYINKDAAWLHNYEKFSTQLANILENTLAVVNKKWWRYFFDIASIMGSKEPLTASTEKCENSLITSIMIAQQSWVFEEKQAEKSIFLWTEKERNTIIKTNILSKVQKKHIPLQDIFIFEEHKPCKPGVIGELLQEWGSDNIRLQCISQEMWEMKSLTINDAQTYDGLLNKIWNASRYVRANFIHMAKKKKWHTSDLEEMGLYLENHIKKMDTHDYRILCRIKELYSEIGEYVEKNNIAWLHEKIIDCIKRDFCDKYLEIIKIQQSDLTDKIAIFCIWMFMQILYPIIPFLTEKIRTLLAFDGDIGSQRYTSFLEKYNKNYKTQLFMDIIDKFNGLRDRIQQAKHEKVDICIHASMDFIQYIKDHEDIVKKIVNAEHISYLDNERDLYTYETEHIIDVTIGIRLIGKVLKPTNNQTTIYKELQQKEEQLQDMRNLTAKLSLDKSNKKIVEKKKEEMSQLKKDIEKLEFEIKKNKINER